MIRRFAVLLVGFSASVSGASAADLASAPDLGGWTFSVQPYVWAAGITGDADVRIRKAVLDRKIPVEIDESISDVLQSLDVGLMGLAEARNGRFSIAADLFWVKLSNDGNVDRRFVNLNGDLSTENLMLTGVVGYSLLQDDGANLDVIAGARLWSVQNQLQISGNIGPIAVDRQDTRTETWVDPLVGLKGSALIGNTDFFVKGWAVVGGFGVSSEIMWDAYGGVGYQFTDKFSTTLGFRALGVDYRSNDFNYDVTQYGPMLGAAFEF